MKDITKINRIISNDSLRAVFERVHLILSDIDFESDFPIYRTESRFFVALNMKNNNFYGCRIINLKAPKLISYITIRYSYYKDKDDILHLNGHDLLILNDHATTKLTPTGLYLKELL